MAARKKKQEIVEALKALITKKGYASSLPYQKVFKELKESCQMVSNTTGPLRNFSLTFYSIYFFLCLQVISRDMFDEVLKVMQEEGVLKVTARQTIKLM